VSPDAGAGAHSIRVGARSRQRRVAAEEETMSNRPDRPVAKLPRVPFVGGFSDGRTHEARTWPPAESVRVACGDAGDPPPTTAKRNSITGESVEVPLTQLYARRELMMGNCLKTYFYAPASWTNRQAVEALLAGYGGDEYRRTLETAAASRAVDHTG